MRGTMGGGGGNARDGWKRWKVEKTRALSLSLSFGASRGGWASGDEAGNGGKRGPTEGGKTSERGERGGGEARRVLRYASGLCKYHSAVI